MSFLASYFGLTDISGEHAVLCPFPHHTSNNIAYYENRPSAHVNLDKGLFHCKSCGAGFNETSFIQEVLGCDIATALRLVEIFKNDEELYTWEQYTKLTEAGLNRIKSFGISEKVARELHMITTESLSIQTPVFIYNHLIDIRTYNPGGDPKVTSRYGCPAGMIVPFDVWRNTPKRRITILCAGEKDMAVARSHGFNAITVTGGELTVPKLLNEFKDRKVVICYDNDDPGKLGALKVANTLYGIARSIKINTAFHEVCKENGEDITDFFTKYNKTRDDLKYYIEQTPEYIPSATDDRVSYPFVDLLTASKAKYVNRLVRSNIQVVATNEASYIVPTTIIGTKYKLTGQNDTIAENAVKEWQLEDDNVQDILHLIDNNFKEDTINQNIRGLLKIPLKEKGISIKQYAKKTVHKAYVTDMFESASTDTVAMEYTAYSLGMRLESGKKYLATYKIVPHPYKGHQLIMIIVNAVQANDTVSKFKITEDTKRYLNEFKNLQGTVAERITHCVEAIKGILGYDGNNTLIETIDLSYHTVLNFNFGSFKDVRGYLDTFIVGESRVGKSSTANALREKYKLGVFASLAGNAATIPGLIGGSNKTNGTYQTRAGLIPQNHRGLIIFEEFGKSNNNIAKELTDIRSSNEVRVTRVSGTITMPAVVRMITLTNVKSTDGQIKPITSYPNGIQVLSELIGTAEDIARYDILLVLSDKGSKIIDPFWEPRKPFSDEAYQTRVRWVWSRTSNDIVIDKDVCVYILNKANELNKQYDTHIKIFGTEAWKKITRLAIAIAGYLVSTDDTYSKLIVTKEHVDYACDYFVRIYDNDTFKLKEYVEHERQYSVVDDAGIALLQDIYLKAPTLILQLEQTTKTSKNMLSAATGLSNDDLNKLLNMLTKGLMVRFSNYDITPTERFRLSVSKINRNCSVKRIGEKI